MRTLANPMILGKVIDVLGWNIRCYHAEIAYKEGVGCSASKCASSDGSQDMIVWHQDSGRINVDVEGNPRPRLSLKVAFYLTDTTDLDSLTMRVIPGSHLNNTLAFINYTQYQATTVASEASGAIPVRVKAGSAIFFDRRLWHAAPLGRNFSKTRKVVLYGFAHRWLQTKDPMRTSDILNHARCPVLRQLLGHIGTYNGLFSPGANDAPL